MNEIINRRAARRFLLDCAKETRHHPFTRVASSAYDKLEAAVRESCRRIVRAQPSTGKTIA